MNTIIKKVVISGFRSIESETLKCGPVNVFCGTNDSGKSNVLRALNLFFNGNTDFLTTLKFSDDYNKVAFAKAVRATKMKQQIKIRVYINPPTSYSSLQSDSGIFIERSFDRNGSMTEKFSNDKKKGVINRLFNKIKYIYIPALKGKDVLQNIMGLIGGYELIDQSDISLLNDKISAKTNDLTEILANSNITIGTSFGLPTLLSDFWERLSVDTNFGKTQLIDEKIQGTGEIRPLNPNQFKIPLTSRGEGIKSKYIPPLLEWLSKNNNENIYVWGIDEPENSLEFSLSEELSNLYYNEYSKKVQCFLTTHSLAFMNPRKDVKFPPQIFRCRKDEYDCTKVFLLENLFKEQDKLELFEEMGVLAAQRELIEKFREYKNQRILLTFQINELQSRLHQIVGDYKCIVLTEDEDVSLLKPILESSGFNLAETDIRTYAGCTNLVAAKIFNLYVKEKFPEIKILIHIDRDYNTDEEVNKLQRKFNDNNIAVFITLGTDIESHYLNPDHIIIHHPDISVEKAKELIKFAQETYFEEAVTLLRKKNFGEKHLEKHSHADGLIKDLPKNEPLKYVKGKSVYSTLKQLIKQNNVGNVNSKIHTKSEYLSDKSLSEFAKKIWPDN